MGDERAEGNGLVFDMRSSAAFLGGNEPPILA